MNITIKSSRTVGGNIAAPPSKSMAHRAVLCAALYALFKYSKLGLAMQASSQNQLAAYYMGIPVKRLNGLVWALAAAVAAIAGLLLAPITFVHANMGFIGLKAFPAAVVGGCMGVAVLLILKRTGMLDRMLSQLNR